MMMTTIKVPLRRRWEIRRRMHKIRSRLTRGNAGKRIVMRIVINEVMVIITIVIVIKAGTERNVVAKNADAGRDHATRRAAMMTPMSIMMLRGRWWGMRKMNKFLCVLMREHAVKTIDVGIVMIEVVTAISIVAVIEAGTASAAGIENIDTGRDHTMMTMTTMTNASTEVMGHDKEEAQYLSSTLSKNRIDITQFDEQNKCNENDCRRSHRGGDSRHRRERKRHD